jgi:hypothetical protein
MNNLATIARIRQSLASRGVIKGNEVATQGYLRLQYDLNQALSSFTFNVLENQGTQTAGEKRLAITDMFTITHWGLYIGRCVIGTAGTFTPSPAQFSLMKLYTNNNPLVFTDGTARAGATTTNQLTNAGGDNLDSLYNGFLQVTVDRERLVDGYDLRRFWRVDAAQEANAQSSAATLAKQQVFQLEGWQGPNYGMSEVDPEITLNGVGQNDITLTLPNSTNFSPSGTYANYAVLIARGIRWQNASKLNA